MGQTATNPPDGFGPVQSQSHSAIRSFRFPGIHSDQGRAEFLSYLLRMETDRRNCGSSPNFHHSQPGLVFLETPQPFEEASSGAFSNHSGFAISANRRPNLAIAG